MFEGNKNCILRLFSTAVHSPVLKHEMVLMKVGVHSMYLIPNCFTFFSPSTKMNDLQNAETGMQTKLTWDKQFVIILSAEEKLTVIWN